MHVWVRARETLGYPQEHRRPINGVNVYVHARFLLALAICRIATNAGQIVKLTCQNLSNV